MNSIRLKIQSALIGNILIIGIFATVVLFINQLSAQKNQQIIETMTQEYSIISLTDNLILKFNDVIKDSDNITTTDYDIFKTSLRTIIASLKLQIVSPESKATLIGVENTVNTVISNSDTGIEDVKNGNLLNFSDYFIKANNQNTFVKDNVQILLQKELEYLSANLTESKYQTNIILIISGSLFVLLVVFMLLFVSSFSQKLVSPIEKLSDTAKRVTTGDMDIKVDQSLLNKKDEIGILSNSFVVMISKIKEKITQLNTSNEEINKSKNALEKSNAELGRLNEFMVGRELKMMELKKRIAELEKK